MHVSRKDYDVRYHEQGTFQKESGNHAASEHRGQANQFNHIGPNYKGIIYWGKYVRDRNGILKRQGRGMAMLSNTKRG